MWRVDVFTSEQLIRSACVLMISVLTVVLGTQPSLHEDFSHLHEMFLEGVGVTEGNIEFGVERLLHSPMCVEDGYGAVVWGWIGGFISELPLCVWHVGVLLSDTVVMVAGVIGDAGAGTSEVWPCGTSSGGHAAVPRFSLISAICTQLDHC